MGGLEPSEEVCNGVDDDCDTEVDESCCVSQAWTSTIVDEGVYVSAGVDASGDVHIAYRKEGIEYAYKSAGETSWDLTRVPAPDDQYSHPTSLVLAAGGVHMAYGVDGGVSYARSLDGVAWDTTVVEQFTAPDDVSIALDPDGDAHVAWGRGGDVYYRNMERGTVESVRVAEETDVSIGVDSGGGIYILYYDGVFKCGHRTAEGEWPTEVVDPGVESGLGGGYSALVVDETGGLHAVYMDDAEGELKYAFRASAGESWVTELVESGSGLGRGCTIAVDLFGAVHVIHGDRSNPNEVRYAYRPGPGRPWSRVALGGGLEAGLSTGIAADRFGGVHAVYEAAANVHYTYSCPER